VTKKTKAVHATKVVTFRTSEREYREYEAAAKKGKVTVSAWVRSRLARGRKADR
jgi:hypothetical protein